MKDDIKPLSPKDPESPNFRPKKDFSKKPGEKEKITSKKDQPDSNKEEKAKSKTKEEIKRPRVSSVTKKNKEKLKKEKRRARLEAQEKLNHRPDLTFFWGMVTLVVIGSLIVLGYLTFYSDQIVKTEDNQATTQESESQTTEKQLNYEDSFYYYISGDDERVKIIKGFDEVENQQTTIVEFAPPADVEKISASWDQDHKFAFVSDKGVEVYNQDQDTRSILAPNRGNREYYYVSFSSDEKIACLYSKLDDHYLEIYSSSLKLLNKKISAKQIGWTNSNQLSYLNINKEDNIYEFKIYNGKKEKYLNYFSSYIGKSRYPITFTNSKTSSKTAFLLRDNSGAKSSIILSIGDQSTNKLVRIAELLYLDKDLDDESIIRPTIVWDKKEDYLYVSVNNQMFKVNITTAETEELDPGFEGTITAISEDSKYLYIRKDNQEGSQIEKPEAIIIYDQGENRIVEQSSLAQINKFLNYNYWFNN